MFSQDAKNSHASNDILTVHGVVFNILVSIIASGQRKAPPFGGAFLLSLGSGDELAIALGVGGLALAARILLLLAGLLAAALLLTGLLTRVLVLLARVRICWPGFWFWFDIRDLPC